MNGKCKQEQLCPTGSSCVPLGVSLDQKYACASLVCPDGYTYSKLTDVCRAMRENAEIPVDENWVAFYKYDTLYLPFDCVRSKSVVNRTLYRFVKQESPSSDVHVEYHDSRHLSLNPPDSPCSAHRVNASYFQISHTGWPHALYQLKLLKPFEARGNFVIISRFEYHKFKEILYGNNDNDKYTYYSKHHHVYYLHVFVN